MEEKVLFDEQVRYISNKLNIFETTVKTVLRAYNALLREEVQMGMDVRVGHIVRIEPNVVRNKYIATTGYEASVISDKQNIPYNTVSNILISYLDMVVDYLRQLRGIDIIGLVMLRSRIDEKSGKLSVSATTSRSVLETLLEDGQSVRVKFNINLRQQLRNENVSNGR